MADRKTYIVEDSDIIRQALIAALEELAEVHVVGCAEDEATAVAWLNDANHECDLVIIDIFLKAGSGLGVLTEANHLARPMTLVVLTNYATNDMRDRCLAHGASKVFDKSNQIEDLIHYCGERGENDARGR